MVAESSADAAPSGTLTSRVVKACTAFAPGATDAQDLLPYGVSKATVVGTSSALVARTVTTTFPATQRVPAVSSTSSHGAGAFSVPRRASS